MSEAPIDHLLHLVCLMADIPTSRGPSFYRSKQLGNVHVSFHSTVVLVSYKGTLAMQCFVKPFTLQRHQTMVWYSDTSLQCIDELHQIFVLEALANV